MKKLFVLFAFIILFLSSCTPKNTSGALVGFAANAEKVAQGKTIYDNSCGKCHDLPEPTAFTSVQWVGIMNSMAPKAKLTDEQHQLVYDYVVSVRK